LIVAVVLSSQWPGHFEIGPEEIVMLHYALVFFVVSLIAAVLGLRGVAGLSANIGYLFAVLAVIFLLVALLTGRSPQVIP
jgi:uncharacterized membrane protein YtjA (UPF0391 family)